LTLAPRLSTFFVNFEPFCGDIKPAERPESRVEGLYVLRGSKVKRK
jgi:hypothetical protein